MEIALDKCICSHSRMMHDMSDVWKDQCILCFGKENDWKKGHKFRLDNLSFIENLAKEKGLI